MSDGKKKDIPVLLLVPDYNGKTAFYCIKTCFLVMNNFLASENTVSVLSRLVDVCNFNCARCSRCYIFILYYISLFHTPPSCFRFFCSYEINNVFDTAGFYCFTALVSTNFMSLCQLACSSSHIFSCFSGCCFVIPSVLCFDLTQLLSDMCITVLRTMASSVFLLAFHHRWPICWSLFLD